MSNVSPREADAVVCPRGNADEGFRAVVVEGTRTATCADCGATLQQYRIEITSGPAKGVRLWVWPIYGNPLCKHRSNTTEAVR